MMKCCRGALITLSFALSFDSSVWAQEAAKPNETSGSSLLVLFICFLPFLIIVLFFLIPATRRTKRNMTQINRSLELSEESVQLAKERVALQKETNELLRQLIAKQSRF